MSLGQIEDPLGLGGHGWVELVRGKGSSSLHCSRCILEMKSISWVWRQKFDDVGLVQLHLESKLKQLNLFLLRMMEVEALKQFL